MKFLETVIEKHLQIINWVGVIVGAWILSMIAAECIATFLPAPTFSAPVANATTTLQGFAGTKTKDIAYYMPICERNIFDAQKRSPCVKNTPAPLQQERVETVDPNAKPVKSSINAKLKGTTVFGDPARSFATITEGGKTSTENFKIDEKILKRARIYKIERNRVFFYNNGRREYLEIDGPSIYADTPAPTQRTKRNVPGIKRNGNNITVSRAKVDSTMANMNKVLQDARMVPNYTNGVVDGFKVFGIKSNSIFQELGLRNGDVINQINGTTVDGLEKALPMLQLLKTQSNFDIGITRRGSKQDLKINVE